MRHDLNQALANSLISIGNEPPVKAVLLSTGDSVAKADMLPACRMLHQKGLELYATKGSWHFLNENGVPAKRALCPGELQESLEAVPGSQPAEEGLESCPEALDLIREHMVDMVVNISRRHQQYSATKGYRLRRCAIDCNVPLFTNTRLATAWVRAFCSGEEIQIKSWDEYR